MIVISMFSTLKLKKKKNVMDTIILSTALYQAYKGLGELLPYFPQIFGAK